MTVVTGFAGVIHRSIQRLPESWYATPPTDFHKITCAYSLSRGSVVILAAGVSLKILITGLGVAASPMAAAAVIIAAIAVCYIGGIAAQDDTEIERDIRACRKACFKDKSIEESDITPQSQVDREATQMFLQKMKDRIAQYDPNDSIQGFEHYHPWYLRVMG